MKIVACRVGKDPQIEELENTLKAMQKFVGGYIERVGLDQRIDLWCDEEFLLKGKNPNRMIVAPLYKGPLVIHGDFFIAAHNDVGDTLGLTDKEAEVWVRNMKDAPSVALVGPYEVA